MHDLRPKQLRSDAAAALNAASYDPRRLVLIHTAVSAGLALALYGVNFLLSDQISQTTGLSGISTTATLEFLQALLAILNALALPIWELGFLWAALQILRRQETGPRSLTAGFRRFFPLLIGKLLQSILLMGAMTLGAYVGTFVFCLTPGAQALSAAMKPYLTGDTLDYSLLLADPAVISALPRSLPFLIAGAAIFALPLFYRLRLVDYSLIDTPKTGPVLSIFKSTLLMRGNRLKLLKLDLSFWWFYLLELIISLVSLGDLLLPLLGLELGMSEDLALLAFYIAALVLQLALYCWKKPMVTVTYAGFYQALLQPPEQAE